MANFSTFFQENKKYGIVFSLILGLGAISSFATAAISPSFPASLPNAVSGAVVKSTDINTVVTSVQNLDKRTMQVSGTNITFLKSDGSVRSGDNQVVITDNGKLGLGTNTPTSTIETVKSGNNGIFSSSSKADSNIGLRFYNDARKFAFNLNGWQGDTIAIWDETLNIDRITFQPNGNIGIGEWSPLEKLTIGANGDTSGSNLKTEGSIKTIGAKNAFGNIPVGNLQAYNAGCNNPLGVECTMASADWCRDQGYSGGKVTQWTGTLATIICAP